MDFLPHHTNLLSYTDVNNHAGLCYSGSKQTEQVTWIIIQ